MNNHYEAMMGTWFNNIVAVTNLHTEILCKMLFNLLTGYKMFLESILFGSCFNIILQVDAIDATGLVIPVSVWVKKLNTTEGKPRCLVVMEPVERTTAKVIFDSTVIKLFFY